MGKKLVKRKNIKNRKRQKPVQKELDPNFELQETIDSENFEEVTNIVEIHENHEAFNNIDFKIVREKIIELVYAKAGSNLENWNLLTSAEKDIAAEWFTIPKSVRETIFESDEVEFELGNKFFHKKSVKARTKRWNAIVADVFSSIVNKADKIEIIQDVLHANIPKINDVANSVTINLHDYYIEFGQEGTEKGDGEALYDYLDSTTGTSFELTGLRSKTFALNNYNGQAQTMTILCDRIMSKIRDGEY